MADESHIPQLQFEDFSAHEDRLLAWARSLDTTPDRLKEIMQRGGEGAKCVRDLLGIKTLPPAAAHGTSTAP
jgi:hypothetical protein